jgi:hypothetical protein
MASKDVFVLDREFELQVLAPIVGVAVGDGRNRIPQGKHKIALADFVLSDHHDAFAGLNVEIFKIGEVDNADAGNAHDGSPYK